MTTVVYTTCRTFSPSHKDTARSRMLASTSSLLIPLALSTTLGITPPSLHHEVRAHVTGYNTIPGQTDSTPCIAASGANICGRRDAVACPRRISLGTIVEIRGTTYVCEDRLAKKYDDRFDISCDKDKSCPFEVAGWTTIKIYGEERPAAPEPAAKVADKKTVDQKTADKATDKKTADKKSTEKNDNKAVDNKAEKHGHAKVARNDHHRGAAVRVAAAAKGAAKSAMKLAGTAVSVIRGHSRT